MDISPGSYFLSNTKALDGTGTEAVPVTECPHITHDHCYFYRALEPIEPDKVDTPVQKRSVRTRSMSKFSEEQPSGSVQAIAIDPLVDRSNPEPVTSTSSSDEDEKDEKAKLRRIQSKAAARRSRKNEARRETQLKQRIEETRIQNVLLAAENAELKEKIIGLDAENEHLDKELAERQANYDPWLPVDPGLNSDDES